MKRFLSGAVVAPALWKAQSDKVLATVVLALAVLAPALVPASAGVVTPTTLEASPAAAAHTVNKAAATVTLAATPALAKPRQTRTPATRPASARDARIVVLRPFALGGAIWPAGVKINGVQVGSVAVNSHVSVVRPAGRSTLAVSFPLAQAEHTFDVQPGRTYYFAINIRSTTAVVAGGGVFMAIPIPGSSVGRPVGQQPLFGGFHISELDAGTGEAMIAKMKN